MKPEVVTRRIEAFHQRFGEAHLYFAYHAAFPLALTPDLLYRLWANFQRDIHGEALKIPWLAVADLLLSSLCDEVGYELYEMETEVRNALLKELKANPRFGEKRIHELSDFLLVYVEQQLESHDPDMRDFAQVQRWTALAYTKPSEAAREIASTLAGLKLEEKTEWVRMASIVETFAEPLAEFEPLLIYSREMANFVRGKKESATAEITSLLADQEPNVFLYFSGHGANLGKESAKAQITTLIGDQEPQLQIAGVNLQTPKQIATSIKEVSPLTQLSTNLPSSEFSRPERILVVDDSPDNLLLIQTILESEGYEIELLGDGTTALAQIQESPPHLIILDVMMPGIDGYEVTRRIRSNPSLPYIPILLISAFTESSVVQGLDTGANDFIRKPIDVDELLARVRSLLRLKHSIDERDHFSRVNSPIPQTTEIAENLADVLKQDNQEVSKTQIKRLLIATANPKDTVRLLLDQEVREIKIALRQRNHKYIQFDIEQLWATRVKDFKETLFDFKPDFIHFSGNGTGEGLIFENSEGKTEIVSADSLAALFQLFAGKVECVLLNADYSEITAEAISKYVDYAIGTSQACGDKDYIKFSIGFYSAIAAGDSPEKAYEMGCAAIQLSGSQFYTVPVLKKRNQ